VSLRTLELAIVNEARGVLKNPKLKLKDILEWNTGDLRDKVASDEIAVKLPVLAVTICVKRTLDKRETKK
jgi:hypothetical protein